MAYDDKRIDTADVKETHDLIASDKVEGTKVYDPNGDHIGSIERILVEKRGGKVSYAVLSFGGFLGIGHDHYPLPWSKLDYDENLGGYRVDITKDQLEGYMELKWEEVYAYEHTPHPVEYKMYYSC